jgi:hypothetical protein
MQQPFILLELVADSLCSSPLLRSVTAAAPTPLPSKCGPVSNRGYGQVKGFYNVRTSQTAEGDKLLSCFVDCMTRATMNEQKLSKHSCFLCRHAPLWVSDSETMVVFCICFYDTNEVYQFIIFPIQVWLDFR